MDRWYDSTEGVGRVESGTETENNARLNGFRRYDSKEGIGRVESGTETESNAGAITEEQLSRKVIPFIHESMTLVPPAHRTPGVRN